MDNSALDKPALQHASSCVINFNEHLNDELNTFEFYLHGEKLYELKGFLRKKSKTRKAWEKRYFYISPDESRLYYVVTNYEQPDCSVGIYQLISSHVSAIYHKFLDGDEPTETWIDLRLIPEIQFYSKKGKFDLTRFNLELGYRTLKIKCDSEKQAKFWVDGLNKWREYFLFNNTTRSSISSSSSSGRSRVKSNEKNKMLYVEGTQSHNCQTKYQMAVQMDRDRKSIRNLSTDKLFFEEKVVLSNDPNNNNNNNTNNINSDNYINWNNLVDIFSNNSENSSHLNNVSEISSNNNNFDSKIPQNFDRIIEHL